MPIESESTFREHCDSLRQEVDIARETDVENIHKASSKLITEIDTYECECLSSWTAVKESNKNEVKNVNKRMGAFIAEQQEFLHSLKASDTRVSCFVFFSRLFSNIDVYNSMVLK